MANKKSNKTMTQQGAFRKDRNAMNKAKKEEITIADIINKMASTHSNPNSAQAFGEASGAVIHVEANMNKQSPVSDAVDAIIAENKALNENGETV